MSRRARFTCVGSLVLAGTGVAAAGQPPALTHNPFSRPPSEVREAENTVISEATSSEWAFELRAILVGTNSNYANVAGEILTIGEEIEGFRLVAVEENKATFLKNEERITVFVKPDPAEQIDE